MGGKINRIIKHEFFFEYHNAAAIYLSETTKCSLTYVLSPSKKNRPLANRIHVENEQNACVIR
jgi:hypothetical protein